MGKVGRYLYIDQLRGLIIALMGLDHASNYFNAVWKRVEYNNFLFDSPGQFVIRYLSYLCAPGFLMLAGAMVWLSLSKQIERNESDLVAADPVTGEVKCIRSIRT